MDGASSRQGATPQTAGEGLLERCQVPVASSQNTGLFGLLSWSSEGQQLLCSLPALSSPHQRSPLLRSWSLAALLSSASAPHPRPTPAHAGWEPFTARAQEPLDLWGPGVKLRSSRHHQIVFLWIGDFTFSMDFAFSFTKHCFKENTWKCSPAK